MTEDLLLIKNAPSVAGISSTNVNVLNHLSTSSRGPEPPNVYICSKCHEIIQESHLLQADNRYWHEDCLRCHCCDCRLGEVGSSLYCKANLLLCKRDYFRMFGRTGYCSACSKIIPAFELVMRAKENVYHLECFACQQCNYRFCVGDKFYLVENVIMCENDYDEHFNLLEQQQTQHSSSQQQQQSQQSSSNEEFQAQHSQTAPLHRILPSSKIEESFPLSSPITSDVIQTGCGIQPGSASSSSGFGGNYSFPNSLFPSPQTSSAAAPNKFTRFPFHFGHPQARQYFPSSNPNQQPESGIYSPNIPFWIPQKQNAPQESCWPGPFHGLHFMPSAGVAGVNPYQLPLQNKNSIVKDDSSSGYGTPSPPPPPPATLSIQEK